MSNPIAPVSLVPFEYGTTTVRTIVREGEPWFVAADVCAVLDLGRHQDSTRYLDDDEKGVCLLDTPSGQQRMTTINEPGLYSLILRSRKPEAKAFKRWITHEVLPALRKNGRYTVGELSRADLARMVLAAEAEREVLESRVAMLEPSATAWDQLAASADDYSVREAAQMLCRAGINTGQNRLFTTLRTLRWVDAHGQPYQKQIDAGRLATRTTSYSHPHHNEPRLSVQVRITPKGLAALRKTLDDGGLPLSLTG